MCQISPSNSELPFSRRQRLSITGSIGDEDPYNKMSPPSPMAVSSMAKVEETNSVDTSVWTPLEVQLFSGSGSRYDPCEMAARRRVPQGLESASGTGARVEMRGRVSMVTPTMRSRQKYHEALWACFEAQTCQDKELVVLETYETSPSAFLQKKAKEDSRLLHVCIWVAPGEDFSVGLKRNMTLHLASGEYIVNFDDDDLYAACYAETMVEEMRSKALYAVTLSSWYNFYVGTGECTYSDPSSWEEWASNQEELDAILYGYGFSYAHRRHVSLESPYPDVRFAEDAPFFLGLRNLYGSDKVALLRDEIGICVHIMHHTNSAEVLGTDDIDDEDIDDLAIAKLAPFKAYRAAATLARQDGLLVTTIGEVLEALSGLAWADQRQPRVACA